MLPNFSHYHLSPSELNRASPIATQRWLPHSHPSPIHLPSTSTGGSIPTFILRPYLQNHPITMSMSPLSMQGSNGMSPHAQPWVGYNTNIWNAPSREADLFDADDDPSTPTTKVRG